MFFIFHHFPRFLCSALSCPTSNNWSQSATWLQATAETQSFSGSCVAPSAPRNLSRIPALLSSFSGFQLPYRDSCGLRLLVSSKEWRNLSKFLTCILHKVKGPKVKSRDLQLFLWPWWWRLLDRSYHGPYAFPAFLKLVASPLQSVLIIVDLFLRLQLQSPPFEEPQVAHPCWQHVGSNTPF